MVGFISGHSRHNMAEGRPFPLEIWWSYIKHSTDKDNTGI